MLLSQRFVFSLLVILFSCINSSYTLASCKKKSKYGFSLNFKHLLSKMLEDVAGCLSESEKHLESQSFTFNLLTLNCKLYSTSHLQNPQRLVSEEHSVYMESLKHPCTSQKEYPCQHNGLCVRNETHPEEFLCECSEGYKGKNCEKIVLPPKNCKDILDKGLSLPGIYSVDPDSLGEFKVLCDTNGSEIFQRRFNGSVDFYRGWDDYKNGFGNLSGEFWLGNEKIHRLTKAGSTHLRVDLERSNGQSAYAVYSYFSMNNETNFYAATHSGYSGTAGDSLIRKNVTAHFSTKDRENDDSSNNCAVSYRGAWWFTACFDSHLNAQYGTNTFNMAICWESFSGYSEGLKKTEMKIKFSTYEK